MTTFLATFAPWQQSVSGSGNVLAYAPNQRPQVIEAPIKGRIVSWGEGIVENAKVTKGQVIAEIRDLDESYASRLDQQLSNSEQAVEASQQQLAANERALEAALTIVDSYQAQVR
ncbi:MAG: toxin secretion protein, partial [Planctomycetaceae bacterium]|nr:toxin secretion protein [Planctomycetaceae bacterium]